jgi:hypothetical protein
VAIRHTADAPWRGERQGRQDGQDAQDNSPELKLKMEVTADPAVRFAQIGSNYAAAKAPRSAK